MPDLYLQNANKSNNFESAEITFLSRNEQTEFKLQWVPKQVFFYSRDSGF